MEVVNFNIPIKTGRKQNIFETPLNWSFKESNINFLIGINGSGKTTLLRTLSGENNSFSGQILYNGNTYYQGKNKLDTSYYFTHHTLIHGIKLIDFIFFTSVLRKESQKQYLKDFDEVLSKLGFGQLVSTNPLTHKISKGEENAVLLTYHLLSPKPIILLDEINAHFSHENMNLFYALLKEYAHKGKIIVLADNRFMDFSNNLNSSEFQTYKM
jgi:ABC-type multidrug transport system ATPase subunit